MSDVLFSQVQLAHETARRAEQAYIWGSNDYHLHARTRIYSQNWVPAAAYQVAQKYAAWHHARAELARKTKIYERVAKRRFEPAS